MVWIRVVDKMHESRIRIKVIYEDEWVVGVSGVAQQYGSGVWIWAVNQGQESGVSFISVGDHGHGSGLWISSIDQRYESISWIRSVDQGHGSAMN